MRLTDPPRPTPRVQYDQAIAAYLKAVGPRAAAVYQVGNVAYPGLSDLDLLVMPARGRFDNGPYFSARIRLPRLYQPLFLHEPFILPPAHAGVLRYTSLRPRLLLGRDLLEGLEPRGDPLPLRIEAMCAYDHYFADLAKLGFVSVRRMVAVASSLRFTTEAPDYGARVDALRARFFDDDTAGEILALFRAEYERTRAALYERLGPDPLRLLREPSPRHDAILRYQETLRQWGFFWGDLFHPQPYAERVAKLEQRFTMPSFLWRTLTGYYRLRRALVQQR